MRNLKDIDTNGKKVLMRVDFNVPFADDGSISDDTRIRAVLPSINYLLEQGARLILCSHCGRPRGKRISKYSLSPIAARLAELLGRPVALAPDCLGAETKEMARNLKGGEVLLLENLRFHAAEQNNEADFARELASLAEIYINDAFAVSHRAHASVAGVTDYLKIKAAGFLLEQEMDFFNRAIANPVKPLAVILGGAKVSSKLGAIRNMLDRVEVMIIGGAMANTFLKSQGFDLGKSLVEDDLLETARELIDLARDKGIAFYLPVDCVAAGEFTPQAADKTTTIYNIPKTWMALDIGPATSLLYQEALAGVKTIVWNGPVGAFEMEKFSRGSLTMVEAVSASPALSIVGGGDTNALINQAGAADKISYMSTGGGAFLMLMEGKELPGVKALE